MYDKQFHRIIAYSAKNPIVEGMIESLLIAHEKTDSLIKVREPELNDPVSHCHLRGLKKHDPVEHSKRCTIILDMFGIKF